jgi:hypothetical protein
MRCRCTVRAIQRPDDPTAASAPAALSGATLDENEHAQLLVRTEAVLSARSDEDCVTFAQLDRFAIHIEDTAAVEHDAEPVVIVWLLAVSSGATST